MNNNLWGIGVSYEPYIGRWSRLVAPEFLKWLNQSPGLAWLDVGCGTGALSQTILDITAPASLKGIDASAGYIAHTRQIITDPRAGFEVADAQSLPFEDRTFDATVSALVLNFVPQPNLMISEMVRVTRSGGTVALYLWDYAGEMQLIRHFWNAAVALNPAAHSRDEGVRFPICQPDPLQKLFIEAGLQSVEVRAIDVPTIFRDFDDYWSPFLGGQGPAPAYAMSLREAERAALYEHLRSHLPVAPDGSIPLIARAWAVCGKVT